MLAVRLHPLPKPGHRRHRLQRSNLPVGDGNEDGLAGQTIPGGAPNNPLKARWLGVNGSVGIHGTAEEWSIGSRATQEETIAAIAAAIASGELPMIEVEARLTVVFESD